MILQETYSIIDAKYYATNTIIDNYGQIYNNDRYLSVLPYPVQLEDKIHFRFKTLPNRCIIGVGSTAGSDLVFEKNGSTYNVWRNVLSNSSNIGSAYAFSTEHDFIIYKTTMSGYSNKVGRIYQGDTGVDWWQMGNSINRIRVDKTYEVLDCIAYDKGTNDIWNVIGTNANLTNNTTTRTFTGNQWSYTQLKVNGSVDIAKDNYGVEFDCVSTTNTSGNFYTAFNIRDTASHNVYLQSNKHYRIEIRDKIYIWIDGVQQASQNHNITTTFQLQMVLREADMNIVFKNFCIYPI